MSFAEREIDVTLQYYQSTNVLKLTGYRVLLTYVDVGGISSGNLSMRIYGLPLSVINEFLAIGAVASKGITRNKILVQAGNKGEPLATVFNGAIFNSWGDFSAPPNVNLLIAGSVQAESALSVANANSWKGSVSAATVMGALAAQAGYAFENNGVTVMLQNPVFDGSLRDQIASCAKQAGIHYTVSESGVLVIYPAGPQQTNPNQGGIPILTPESGLIGYPMFSNQGISVRSIFLPGMRFGMPFIIRGSQIPMANRTWYSQTVVHTLESQAPNGPWFSELEGFSNVV